MSTTTNKKKLLYIPSWFVKPNGKDPSVFLEAYAKMFRDNGYATTVLHVYMKGNFINCLFKKKVEISNLWQDDLHIIRIGIAPAVPYFRTLNYWIAWLLTHWYLKRKVDIKHFDIVNSHVFFLGGFVGSKISDKYNIPQIHTEHFSGFLETTVIKKSEIQLFFRSIKCSKKLVLVSKSFKDHFINLNPDLASKATVIPNFISSDFNFAPIKNVGKFKFIAIGAADGNKNIRLLLNAWDIFCKDNNSVELTLLATNESIVKEHFKNLKIPDNITIIPAVPHDQVPQFIQKHHCLVSTSFKETFGLSILEALACGRPVVTTNSGGILDFVNESNGLISSNDPQQFAETLIKMVKNYDQYELVKISEQIHAVYSKEQVFKQYDTLFRKCLSVRT